MRHTGNIIREYGSAAKGLVHPSGIVTAGGGSIFSNNLIVSNGRTTRFGINPSGFPPPEVVPDGSRNVVLTGNRLEGDFDVRRVMPNMQQGEHGTVLSDLPETPCPARINLAERLTADHGGLRCSSPMERLAPGSHEGCGPTAVVRDGDGSHLDHDTDLIY